MSVTSLQSLVHRVDETTSNIPNPHSVPITLFANRDVPIELEAVEQALGCVSVQGTIDDIWERQRAGSAEMREIESRYPQGAWHLMSKEDSARHQSFSANR